PSRRERALELPHAARPEPAGDVLHDAQAEHALEPAVRELEAVGRVSVIDDGRAAVTIRQTPERVESRGAEDEPLGDRSEVPVEALPPVEDEARSLVEGRVGD